MNQFFRELITTLCFLGCVLVTSQAYSQQVITGELKPLPDPVKLSLDEYAEMSAHIERGFDEDRSISFSVDLPKTWAEEPFISLKNYTKGGLLYGDLGRFDGPSVGELRPIFRVRGLEISREISAENWLMTHLLSNGYTPWSLDIKSDNEFEAMYVVYVQNTQQSFVVRAKGKIVGPRIILAEHILPMDLWSDQQDIQTFALKSVEINGTGSEYIEPHEVYAYLNAISFELPSSWTIHKIEDNHENMLFLDIANARPGEPVRGNIGFSMMSPFSIKDPKDKKKYSVVPNEIMERARGVYAIENLEQGEFIERPDLGLDNEKYIRHVTEVYELVPVKTEYETHITPEATHEFWITALTTPGKVFFLTLYTPLRKDDLYTWAINVETYKNIIKNLNFSPPPQLDLSDIKKEPEDDAPAPETDKVLLD